VERHSHHHRFGGSSRQPLCRRTSYSVLLVPAAAPGHSLAGGRRGVRNPAGDRLQRGAKPTMEGLMKPIEIVTPAQRMETITQRGFTELSRCRARARRWPWLCLAFGAILCLCGAGCATATRSKDTALGILKPASAIELSEKTLRLNYTKAGATNYYRTVFLKVRNDTNAAKEWGNQQEVRNQMIDELSALIDQDFFRFGFNLDVTKNTKDLVAALSVLGLTTASAVVGGAQTKTILSAIAAGVTGTSLAFDKTLFKDLTLQAIRHQMEALRATKKKVIIANRSKSIENYSLDMALGDIVDYYYCGYVHRALDALVATADEAAKKAAK
jgi:hypothetical protein